MNGKATKGTEGQNATPEVTRQRMYLETMERLFGGTDKIIIDQGIGGNGGIVPYLPLDQLSRRPQTPPQTGGTR